MIKVCAMPISLDAAAVFGVVVAVSVAPAARAAERVTVTVRNPSAFSRTDELIRIENAPLQFIHSAERVCCQSMTSDGLSAGDLR